MGSRSSRPQQQQRSAHCVCGQQRHRHCVCALWLRRSAASRPVAAPRTTPSSAPAPLQASSSTPALPAAPFSTTAAQPRPSMSSAAPGAASGERIPHACAPRKPGDQRAAGRPCARHHNGGVDTACLARPAVPAMVAGGSARPVGVGVQPGGSFWGWEQTAHGSLHPCKRPHPAVSAPTSSVLGACPSCHGVPCAWSEPDYVSLLKVLVRWATSPGSLCMWVLPWHTYPIFVPPRHAWQEGAVMSSPAGTMSAVFFEEMIKSLYSS